VTAVLGHAYIWFCLFLFVLPFAALLFRSFAEYGGSSGLENYRGAIGDFKENLFWSVRITFLALAIDLAVSLPAAYALVRYPVPGRRIIFSILQLSLYVPGAVIGLALLLTYTFTYHAVSMWGLVLAMAVGTFPLMLTPIVVALKDLPPEFEEAGQVPRRDRLADLPEGRVPADRTGRLGRAAAVLHHRVQRVPGHAVRPPGRHRDRTAADLQPPEDGGLSPATAALAVTMQLVSFAAVLVFFRVFGTRHFKGTYIL
jgi:ABC-type sulfate transport system permease component